MMHSRPAAPTQWNQQPTTASIEKNGHEKTRTKTMVGDGGNDGLSRSGEDADWGRG